MKLTVTSCSDCRWFIGFAKKDDGGLCRCLSPKMPFGATQADAEALFAEPKHGLTEIHLPIANPSKPPGWCPLRMGPITVELVS